MNAQTTIDPESGLLAHVRSEWHRSKRKPSNYVRRFRGQLLTVYPFWHGWRWSIRVNGCVSFANEVYGTRREAEIACMANAIGPFKECD